MALPEAVKQAQETVDKLEAEMFGDEKPAETQDATDTETPKEEQPPEEAPEEQGPEEGDPVEDILEDLEDLEYEEPWEQKYRTLLGKYNAEVPRLSRDVDFLQGQVTALSSQKAEEPQAEPTNGQEAPKTTGYKKYLTDDELEDYDEKILEFQSRVVRGAFEELIQAELEPYRQAITKLLGQVDSQQTMTFWDHVEADYPGAKDINDNDADWIEFLEQEDPLTGNLYRDIGESAIKDGRVDVIVQLLEMYEPSTLEEQTIVNEEVPTGPPVKPSRNHGGTAPTKPKAKNMITQADIAKFFDDVTRGKYKGREAEMKKREAEIDEAATEGRIAG